MPDSRFDTNPLVFEALIAPHRSLTPHGRKVLIGLFSLLVAGISLRFFLVRAWPVVAFSALEVPLIVLLLALNVRHARARELIMLDSRDLTVVRTDPLGRRTAFSLPAAWLQVAYEGQDNRRRVLLQCRGTSREIAAFLHDEEKESLVAALRSALYGLRNPRFDNPQLRDET